MNISLSFQRQSIEHLIPACEKTDPQLVPALKAAALTIGWIERRAELIREIDRLEREAPELAEILRTLPGTRIVDINEPKMIPIPPEYRNEIIDEFEDNMIHLRTLTPDE